MANINTHWRRFMAVGCSHGDLADSKALKTVLKFSSIYKPHRKFHLGDFSNLSAMRSGAKGTKDEASSIDDDLQCGLNFLEAYEPTDLLNGNHEIRAWKLMEHPHDVIARAAKSIVQDVRTHAKKLKCNYIESYAINESWIQLADTKLLHGFMFNQQACRDHAEHFGKCIIAHTHKAETAPGRRADHPRCWSVGTLANIPAMDYAASDRSSAQWSKGLVYGEYNDKTTVVWQSTGEHNQEGGWRLPI